MLILTVMCYVAASICFLVSVVPHKIQPRSLDLLALGLFLFTLPSVVNQVRGL